MWSRLASPTFVASALVTALLVSTTLHAHVQPDAATSPRRSLAAAGKTVRLARVSTASIQGAVWKADNTPAGGARLRLRNVGTGAIQATTVATPEGMFKFHDVAPGAYAIEMVAENGRVLLVGHTFTVAAGEAVATFLRLGAKLPWFTGFFGSAAQAIAASAASTGITALAPEEIPPVSSVR